MIWIVFAIVTACAILAVARPLGSPAAPASGAASEIEAYKAQLAELDREEERGEIGNEEAEQTRTEISRRLLKAGRQSGSAALPGRRLQLNANYAFIAL
ncbi:MAG: c-type cytochrome biogenesis protein CcmI, partial [Rhodomicrobium sp.]